MSKLDDFAFKLFAKKAAESKRVEESILKESNKAILQKLHLIDGEYLKKATALLFAEDPEEFVTGAFIKIGFFKTDYDLIYQDEIHGNLFAQVDKTIDLLCTKYMKAYIRYEGLQRIDEFLFHPEALREALLNAVVHKDYSSGNPIQISVYGHKLYIWNSGELPPELNLAKLQSKHPSIPFNPLIASAFFRGGYIEAWGRGIEKINVKCDSISAPHPEYNFEFGGLMILFKAKDKPMEQESKKITDGEAPVETHEVTPEVARMLAVIVGEMSRREIMNLLSLKDEKHFRKHYQQTAVSTGIIEMTIADKPNSRLQKYRLTEKGKMLLKNLKGNRSE